MSIDPDKKKEESFTDKLKGSIESLKKNEKVDQVVRYASRNTRDMLAYILMLTGIFLLYFQPAYAGALVGVIFGLYFSQELADFAKNYQSFFDKIGPVRSLILLGLIVAFVISAPFIFLGAIVAVAVRQLIE